MTLLFCLAMLLGYASWVLPVLIIPGNEQIPPPIRLFSDKSIYTDTKLSWNYSLAFLILTGMFLGFLGPRHWLRLGACTMLLVFIVATLELLLELEPPHKLYGIEIMMYIVLTLPGIIGAWLGSFIRRKLYPSSKMGVGVH